MNVSTFYDPCEDKKFFKSLQEKNENLIFAEMLRFFLDTIEDFDVSRGLPLMEDLLRNALKSVEFEYNWLAETFLKDSVDKVRNLLVWLGSNFDKKVEGSALCSYMNFEQNVSLVCSKGGNPTAVIVSVGKNKFSPNGRSVLTKSENNLAGLVIKGALESKYPGIGVACVYLSSDKDVVGNIADSFLINNTKSSNVFVYDFSGVDVNARIKDLASYTPTSDCFTCKYSALCKQKHKKPRAEVRTSEEKKDYVLPSFTPSQMRAVKHLNGPLLVVAPPGSGKTATLVGRMKWLIEQGVDPAFILAISFTKAAAAELTERCKSFCEEGSLPTCSTINALALNILTQNENVVGKVKTLTTRENLRIIDEILSVIDPLADFNYSNKYGQYGLLKTAARRLDKFKALGFSREDMLSEMKGDVSDAFYDFAAIYFERIKAEGYITYDEQVEMAVKFLQEYPEATGDYQALFKYVMVDEYQDVNESQKELIYLIAGHRNLVVVGDDDQSIYGWRGAKAQIMRDFLTDFKAQKVELMENFRSTSAIFDASKEVVKVNNRIEKEGKAVRTGGTAPIYRTGVASEDVQEAINDALRQGYGYKDIAVIAGTNKVLEDLDTSLVCPTKLQKFLVIDTEIFNCIYYGLKVSIEPSNKEAKWMLDVALAGRDVEALKPLLKANDVAAIIDGVAEFVNAPEEEVTSIKGVCEESQVESVEDMYSLFEYMVNFEDDTRVDVVSNRADEVLLITSHESKGLEFPVVILLDDKKVRNSDEERRVLYVSMTRAKDLLFVLKKGA